MSMSKWQVRSALPVFFVSLSVACAWIIGDLSSPGFTRDELDYTYGPVDIPFGLGMFASVVLMASASILLKALRGRVLAGAWLPFLVFLAGASVMIGFAFRVFTAGVIGADIGAGLLMIFGGPLFCIYLLIAAVIGVRTYFRLHRPECLRLN
jgi:hypothetical protein